MRRTKIIATLGPATESPEILEQLIREGVAIFRLNMSHASRDWTRQMVAKIREISRRLEMPVGLMMDTQGPEIRTGDLAQNLSLRPGDRFTFTVRGSVCPEEHSVDVNYDELINDINVDDVVLVDSGVMRMKVLAKDSGRIACEVLTPGTLTSRRHINLPGVRVNLPPMTAKDIADITLAVELKLDFIALSFVREAQDVITLRNLLRAQSPDHLIRIVAKIEDQQAVKNLSDIIENADAIMVARGDLGLECALEELPIIQRRTVRECILRKKRVIVATHMLESMITNPIPTRAEVTDVANAVLEQADAIMLSGETSVGRYPVECVKIMGRIAERIEQSGNAGFAQGLSTSEPREALVASAVELANHVRAAGIVVFTRYGRMGSLAGAFRPKHSPIFAFSPDPATITRLTLRWGLIPVMLPFSEDRESTVEAAVRRLVELKHVKPLDQLVIVTDLQSGETVVDAVQLRTVLPEGVQAAIRAPDMMAPEK